MNYKIGCFIFHRDFRIQDNRGLNDFCKLCDIVIPIFVFTPNQIDNDKNHYKSIHSVRFMIEALSDLYTSIDKNLFTFYGDLLDVLKELYKKTGFHYIGFNQDITPFSIKRTRLLKKVFGEKILTYNDYYLCDFESPKILNDNKPYVKFTAFKNRCIDYFKQNTDLLQVVERTYEINKKIKKSIELLSIKQLMSKYSISLDDAYLKFLIPSNHICCKSMKKHSISLTTMDQWEATRNKGIKILKQLNDGVFNSYGKNRNELSYKTTQLSAFLKYGLLSVREVAKTMLNMSSIDDNPLFRQLLWRDFYAIILYYNPRVLKEPFHKKYSKLQWENNTLWTQLWKDGKTGFPIVDACMTQLNKTGYMHNRGRLIVSSFLVKLLLTDWRKGERYFASMLIDYDPASNNGNWQWVAGTGTDSMPYFRIFNPWLQSEKYDKDALYIKKWLPQLKEVKTKHLHQWDEHYEEYDLKKINYLKPIVDYKERREKAIHVYKKV